MMIIENVEALKSWLSKLLEPICDADPSALANYVVALVKKDKPEKDLRALCADQLDVFLQKETSGFVDKLFECLTTKNYLGNLEQAIKTVPKVENKLPVQKADDKKEAVNVEDEKDGRRRRSPLRNRSDLNESRVRDDRRRDDRKRRDQDRYGKSGDSYRERHDRRPGNARGRSRSRSRSGSRGQSGDKDRSRGKEHRTKFEVERKEPEGYVPSSVPGRGPPQPQPPQPLLAVPVPPPPPQQQQQLTSGGPTLTSSIPVVAASHLPDSTTESWSNYYSNYSEGKPFGKSAPVKHRCRDYDEKGVCVRGDLCPFDHGNDPLIVDDVTLPAMIPFPPPPGVPLPRVPMRSVSDPPPDGRLPMPPITKPPDPRVPMRPHGQPPPPGVFSMADKYDPDTYNPEAPGITAAGRPQYRQFIPRVQTQRSNLIGLTSRDMEIQNSRAANIVIQTEPSVSAVSNNTSRYSGDQESRKRPHGATNGPPPKKPWMDKPTFNNQHKPGFQKNHHYSNTKLEVRKIPRDLNNITKLNEHFSKFGTIVNIQVVFGGDPEAALIQYTANEEARRAISSTEAVLNNRFIRVYWHRDGSDQQQAPPQAPSPSAPMGPPQPAVHKAMTTSVNLRKGAYSSPVMNASSKSFGKTAKALEAEEAVKKKQEALKLQQDMTKKKQEMLEKQIECQKALINRLEKNKGVKPEERASIMKTLKELTEKISQLKDELTPATNSSAQPKTKLDAQKELLDAELDFHKKLSSGEDTADLKRRLGQLQVEATRLGLIPAGRGRGTPGRGRGRDRGRSMRGRGGGSNMVVDHRPRALAILGVTKEEKEELIPHFQKFGEIEDLRDRDATSVVMSFKTRSAAENAANQGANFNGRTLQISWYKPKMPSVSSEPAEESSKDKEMASSLLLPVEEEEDDDDDEEDEYESRSWRR